MLDDHLLIDAHLHPARLPTLKPAWREWADRFGDPRITAEVYDADGTPVPERFAAHLEAEGVDHAIALCEHSPRVTGIQPPEDLLPLIKHAPTRVSFLANVNPHLHYPLTAELERQLGLGAIGLKVHPVHGAFPANDREMYPAYQICQDLGLPVVVHCGTSSFPGSVNRYACPELLDDIVQAFPRLHLVLAHGGRGWWYDGAAFLATLHERVWIELSGLPPQKLPEYYARHNFPRLARKFIFGTDWPGIPGIARNARAILRLGLDDETNRLILAGNAQTVYPALLEKLSA
ncbi:amidohydrolase [Streptomyces sp. A7024]|uniref:Amidohydrolase n=1 Tax=Streptomyces coryli TaxID=1128680 RepID=A0A6G4TVZ5_9ACTN|nr:amidohydrolase family protein [Streptomyces coryli]NGN64169.1 amidohydrolase [Streptomyces coryli]